MQIKRTNAAPAAHAFDILAIIFVGLLVATAFYAYTLYSKKMTEDAKFYRAVGNVRDSVAFRSGGEDVQTLQERRDELQGELRNLSRVLGFYRGEDAASNVGSVVALLNEINAEYGLNKTEANPKNLIESKGILTVGESIKRLEDRIDKLVNGDSGIKSLEAKRDKIQGEYEKGTGAVGTTAEEAKAAVEALEKKLDGKLAEVKSARSANAKAISQKLQQRDSALDAVKRARQQKKKVQNSLFEVKKTYKDEVDRLSEKLDNVLKGLVSLEDVVRAITKTERDKDQRRPDGEILSSNSRMQVAWINLTRRDRIMKGMKFEVFRYRKGGKETPRGKVQVIQVGDRMSKVRILERYYKDQVWKMQDMSRAPAYVLREFDIDPLQQGDMLRNRFFDKREKRVFVFAGKLTGPPNAKASYKTDEAIKLLEELGDEVTKGVNERTSYVVLGEGYREDENYKLAEELGIPKMSERELMEVLGKY